MNMGEVPSLRRLIYQCNKEDEYNYDPWLARI